MRRALCLLPLFILPTLALAAGDTDPVRVVRAQLEAFNRHDADALAAFLAADVTWYNVTDNAVSMEGKGRANLKDSMTLYFKKVPTAHSEIDGVNCVGEYVTFRETATWTAAEGDARSQSCVAVYQVHDGLITRTWYYPTTDNPAKP